MPQEFALFARRRASKNPSRSGNLPPNDEKNKGIPTLRQFQTTFDEWVAAAKSEQNSTVKFYQESYRKLRSYGPWADLSLDRIDEAHIEAFKAWALKQAGRRRDGKPTPVGKTTVNRYWPLSARPCVMRHLKLKLIAKVPTVEQCTKDEGAERETDYIFSAAEYAQWTSRSSETLRSASILARHSGICCNEMLELMKDCVRLHSEQRADGKICGELLIKRGLKRRARKRKLVIDREMKEVLERLLKNSQCDYVLTSPQDPKKPLGPWVLGEQIGQLRKKIKTNPDAGLHAMRHTFLTEAGEYPDPFTLQYVAGRDNIKTTMRYTRGRQRSTSCLCDWQTCSGLRIASRARSRCKIRCSWKCPHKTNLLNY